MQETTEQWREVVGSAGWYEVSDLGNVRSLDRVITRSDGVAQLRRGRILSATPDGCGYLQVKVAQDGPRVQQRKVHQLVLEAFVGPRPEMCVACHNNGNNQDNRLSNLRWDTHLENSRDTQRHGRNFQRNKTHCIRGHEFTPENTNYNRSSGARLCKVCQQDQSRRAYALKLARKSGLQTR